MRFPYQSNLLRFLNSNPVERLLELDTVAPLRAVYARMTLTLIAAVWLAVSQHVNPVTNHQSIQITD